MTVVPRRAALRSAALVAAGAAGACSLPGTGSSDGTSGRSGSGDPSTHEVVVRSGSAATALDATGGASAATVAASVALLERATAVVLATDTDAEIIAGTAAASALGVPLLVEGPGVAAELDRLRTTTVLRYAAAPAPSASGSESTATVDLGDLEVIEGTPVDELPELPGLPRTSPAGTTTVLVLEGTQVPPALRAVLAAAGAAPTTVPDVDPRASDTAVAAVRAGDDVPVLALGPGFGPDDRLTQRVRTARKAAELPGGGLLPFPGRRMVALYGHPQTKALGMLGEQGPKASVRRAQALAEEYAELTDDLVIPAFEIIATIASGSKGDGSYSRRTPIDVLRPLVEAAEGAGIYVVLDLQPGRTDFLEQAKHYEELLRRPWVGLALDPEWRLRPDQVHLKQIGSVGVDEVNRVGAWLAGLVRTHDLPPKVVTLHQFRASMVRERERLDTSLDEVQWLMHADGQGGQNAKQGTWAALRRDLPEGVWVGWKNFEDEDVPMLTPEQTMRRVQPTPWFVSYQ